MILDQDSRLVRMVINLRLSNLSVLWLRVFDFGCVDQLGLFFQQKSLYLLNKPLYILLSISCDKKKWIEYIWFLWFNVTTKTTVPGRSSLSPQLLSFFRNSVVEPEKKKMFFLTFIDTWWKKWCFFLILFLNWCNKILQGRRKKNW